MLSVPSWATRRLLALLIRSFLGSFLDSEFDTAQLEVQLGSGYIGFSNLGLDCAKVNEAVGAASPLLVTGGRVRTVEVRVPVSLDFTLPVVVSLSGVSVDVAPRDHGGGREQGHSGPRDGPGSGLGPRPPAPGARSWWSLPGIGAVSNYIESATSFLAASVAATLQPQVQRLAEALVLRLQVRIADADVRLAVPGTPGGRRQGAQSRERAAAPDDATSGPSVLQLRFDELEIRRDVSHGAKSDGHVPGEGLPRSRKGKVLAWLAGRRLSWSGLQVEVSRPWVAPPGAHRSCRPPPEADDGPGTFNCQRPQPGASPRGAVADARPAASAVEQAAAHPQEARPGVSGAFEAACLAEGRFEPGDGAGSLFASVFEGSPGGAGIWESVMAEGDPGSDSSPAEGASLVDRAASRAELQGSLRPLEAEGPGRHAAVSWVLLGSGSRLGDGVGGSVSFAVEVLQGQSDGGDTGTGTAEGSSLARDGGEGAGGPGAESDLPVSLLLACAVGSVCLGLAPEPISVLARLAETLAGSQKRDVLRGAQASAPRWEETRGFPGDGGRPASDAGASSPVPPLSHAHSRSESFDSAVSEAADLGGSFVAGENMVGQDCPRPAGLPTAAGFFGARVAESLGLPPSLLGALAMSPSGNQRRKASDCRWLPAGVVRHELVRIAAGCAPSDAAQADNAPTQAGGWVREATVPVTSALVDGVDPARQSQSPRARLRVAVATMQLSVDALSIVCSGGRGCGGKAEPDAPGDAGQRADEHAPAILVELQGIAGTASALPAGPSGGVLSLQLAGLRAWALPRDQPPSPSNSAGLFTSMDSVAKSSGGECLPFSATPLAPSPSCVSAALGMDGEAAGSTWGRRAEGAQSLPCIPMLQLMGSASSQDPCMEAFLALTPDPKSDDRLSGGLCAEIGHLAVWGDASALTTAAEVVGCFSVARGTEGSSPDLGKATANSVADGMGRPADHEFFVFGVRSAESFRMEACCKSVSVVLHSSDAPIAVGLHVQSWPTEWGTSATETRALSLDQKLLPETHPACLTVEMPWEGSGTGRPKAQIYCGAAAVRLMVLSAPGVANESCGNDSNAGGCGRSCGSGRSVVDVIAWTAPCVNHDSVGAFSCSVSARVALGEPPGYGSAVDSGQAFRVDRRLMRAWEEFGRSLATSAPDKAGTVPAAHRAFPDTMGGYRGAPGRGANPPGIQEDRDVGVAALGSDSTDEWYLHHITAEASHTYVDVCLPMVSIRLRHQLILDLGALLKDLSEAASSGGSVRSTGASDADAGEDQQGGVRSHKIARKAGSGMVTVAVTATQASVEVASQQTLTLPLQLHQHRYQLPRRRFNSAFRGMAGRLAVTTVSNLAGHPLCSALGVSAGAISVQELSAAVPTFPLGTAGDPALLPMGLGFEDWPGAWQWDRGSAGPGPGLAVWSVVTGHERLVAGLSATHVPSSRPGTLSRGVSPTDDLGMSMHLGVCREEERSPVWGWDSDSSGGERGSLRPNAEELTDRARRNASHLLFGGAFQTTFEDATGEAQAETNCVNDRGPPDEAVKKQLAGRAEDISVWQDVGLLVGGQREALWTLHSHLAVDGSALVLTTDPGRASADWLEAFLDTLKIPAPIAPSVQSDVRSCVVRLKQAQLRLRPIPGSRAFASLSCEEVDYVSGTHVRDTHHIVLRGLELAVGVSAQTQNSGASGPQVHPSTIPWQALPVIASDSSLVITVCSRNKEATRPRVVHASQEAFVPPVWEVLVTNAHLRVATTPEDLVALKHLAGDVGKAPARPGFEERVPEEVAAAIIGDMLLDSAVLEEVKREQGGVKRLQDLVTDRITEALLTHVTDPSEPVAGRPAQQPGKASPSISCDQAAQGKKPSGDAGEWEVISGRAMTRASEEAAGQSSEGAALRWASDVRDRGDAPFGPDQMYMTSAAHAAGVMRVRADPDLVQGMPPVRGQIIMHDVHVSWVLVGDRPLGRLAHTTGRAGQRGSSPAASDNCQRDAFSADDREEGEDAWLAEGGELEFCLEGLSVAHALFHKSDGVSSRTVVTAANVIVVDHNMPTGSAWHRVLDCHSTRCAPRRDSDPAVKVVLTVLSPVGTAGDELDITVRVHPLRAMVDQHVVMLLQRVVRAVSAEERPHETHIGEQRPCATHAQDNQDVGNSGERGSLMPSPNSHATSRGSLLSSTASTEMLVGRSPGIGGASNNTAVGITVGNGRLGSAVLGLEVDLGQVGSAVGNGFRALSQHVSQGRVGLDVGDDHRCGRYEGEASATSDAGSAGSSESMAPLEAFVETAVPDRAEVYTTGTWSVHQAPIAGSSPRGAFFQRVRVDATSVCIDYRPRHMDATELGKGNLAELLNAAPFQEVAITLKGIELKGVLLTEAGNEVGAAWARDIALHQTHRIIQGLPAFRSVHRISTAAGEVFSRPWRELTRPEEVLSHYAQTSISEWEETEDWDVVSHHRDTLEGRGKGDAPAWELLKDRVQRMLSATSQAGQSHHVGPGPKPSRRLLAQDRVVKSSAEFGRALRQLGKAVATEVCSVGVGLSEGAEFILSGHTGSGTGDTPSGMRDGARRAYHELTQGIAAAQDISARTHVRKGDGPLLAAGAVARAGAGALRAGAHGLLSAARVAMQGAKRDMERGRRRPHGWVQSRRRKDSG